jgi:hypothetical protein
MYRFTFGHVGLFLECLSPTPFACEFPHIIINYTIDSVAQYFSFFPISDGLFQTRMGREFSVMIGRNRRPGTNGTWSLFAKY